MVIEEQRTCREGEVTRQESAPARGRWASFGDRRQPSASTNVFPLTSTRLRPSLLRGRSRLLPTCQASGTGNLGTSPSSAMSMLEREAVSLPFTDEHQRAAYESRHRLERGMGVLKLRQGQISSRGTTVP